MSRLYVNGKEIEVDGKRRLMDVLRKDCHLKSVKDGCSQGACGTCTVVVDGKTVKSCVQTADKFEGKHILTVEGLSDYEKQVYVYAFSTAGAVQCGFCTPGMVMCAKALLDRNRLDGDLRNRSDRGGTAVCAGHQQQAPEGRHGTAHVPAGALCGACHRYRPGHPVDAFRRLWHHQRVAAKYGRAAPPADPSRASEAGPGRGHHRQHLALLSLPYAHLLGGTEEYRRRDV